MRVAVDPSGQDCCAAEVDACRLLPAHERPAPTHAIRPSSMTRCRVAEDPQRALADVSASDVTSSPTSVSKTVDVIVGTCQRAALDRGGAVHRAQTGRRPGSATSDAVDA